MPHFLTRSEVQPWFEGKRVALVGSGPGVLGNEPGFIDAHDVVVRVNNYRVGVNAGIRCDVHYSFFGASILKSVADLRRDGVRLCLCKCPDGQPIESEWHQRHRMRNGVDFSYIYRLRRDWWFCPVFIPSAEDFLRGFKLLDNHVPTTGFSAILDLLSWRPQELYLTGFDFFRSGKHNVSEPWRLKNTDDPIGHVPEFELAWLRQNIEKFPTKIAVDGALAACLMARRAIA